MKADWDGHPGAEQWTGCVRDALAISTLPSTMPVDWAMFWAGYKEADEDARQQFWIMLISAIAKEESNFNPDCVYQEPPPLNQKSIGLMQLSLTDVAYGCDFSSENDVKDAARNLRCGVRIMTKLVSKGGRIGGDPTHIASGAAAYWSTLRTPKPGARNSRGYIISRTQSLSGG